MKRSGRLLRRAPHRSSPANRCRRVQHPDRATHLRAMVRFAVLSDHDGCPMDLAVFCFAWHRNGLTGPLHEPYGAVWLWLLVVGCGEAVRPFIFSGPIPTIPRELFRRVQHPDRATHLRAPVSFAVHSRNNGYRWIWPCSVVHGIALG